MGALLEQGFRPFFLGAALFAGIATPAWVAALIEGAGWPTHLAPLDWHIHEMIFGYFGAVLSGFLLTAIPNWTSRLPVRGGPLAALAVLWLAGRIAMAVSAGWPIAAAVLDASYLVVLTFVVWRELVASRNTKNLPVGALVALVALCNIGFHAAELSDGDRSIYVRAALGAAALLMALIGGRIVPSFTRNWLVKQGEASLPAAFGAFDKLALAVLATTLVSWIGWPDAPHTGALLVLAAVLHTVRISRWRFWRAAHEPLLSILHLGSFWLAIWLALQALAILHPELIDASTALHALTTGAIGTMTLAVMSRAIRGHTGRELTADRLTVIVYILVNAGAALRLAVPFFAFERMQLLAISGAVWAGAFIIFAIAYAPMVFRSRERM
jgi:uncharacterized protein involved in response to NO